MGKVIPFKRPVISVRKSAEAIEQVEIALRQYRDCLTWTKETYDAAHPANRAKIAAEIRDLELSIDQAETLLRDLKK